MASAADSPDDDGASALDDVDVEACEIAEAREETGSREAPPWIDGCDCASVPGSGLASDVPPGDGLGAGGGASGRESVLLPSDADADADTVSTCCCC